MLLTIIALSMQGSAVAAPPPEAIEVGRRLAATGALATIVPQAVEKDLTELADEAPALTPPERERLMAIGRAQGAAALDRLIAAMGEGYAKRLSVADMLLLAEHAESEVARRGRAAEFPTFAEAMAKLGEIDMKKNVAAAFCIETKKLCARD